MESGALSLVGVILGACLGRSAYDSRPPDDL